MRFREIADARNAVFFNRKGGFEAGKSSFAERRVRDGLGSCSDRGRNRPSIAIRVLTCFLKCRFRGSAALCEPPRASFVAGAALCEPSTITVFELVDL